MPGGPLEFLIFPTISVPSLFSCVTHPPKTPFQEICLPVQGSPEVGLE